MYNVNLFGCFVFLNLFTGKFSHVFDLSQPTNAVQRT